MAGFGMGKMVIGQAGKKYGLHRPNAAPPGKPASSKNSIFGEDDDDEGAQPDALKALASDKHREKMQKRAEREMAKALAEDASIFDYDGAHDGIAKEREEKEVNKKAATKVRGEVRYVHQLLEKTRERKKEDEKLFEKQLVKDLKKEEEEFGVTEKFVTSAYKKQLLANKAFEEEQARLEAINAKDDVRNKDSMADFFSNMLKGKNKASGGAAARGASPIKDMKERNFAKDLGDLDEAAAAHPDAGAYVKPERSEDGGEEGGGGERADVKEEEEESAPAPVSLMPSAQEAGLDKGGGEAEQGAEGAEGEGGAGSKRKYDGWKATALGYVKERKEIEVKPDVKKDETAVLSARERFLQRKKQKEEAAAAGK